MTHSVDASETFSRSACDEVGQPVVEVRPLHTTRKSLDLNPCWRQQAMTAGSHRPKAQKTIVALLAVTVRAYAMLAGDD